MAGKEKKQDRSVAVNRKAFHDYFVEEKFEAGIELCGTEVKSLRAGGVNLKDAWCDVKGGEIFVKQMHISPYDHGNIFNRDPMRTRKLLLHKREIMRLAGLSQREGYALIPLELYWKGPHIKVALGLCKGKKLYDKRSSEAAKDLERAGKRAVKEFIARTE
ncbi:MAG: SsrA-binding protein SmpB [Oscillospiraceae bacterium]|nr:SsrA-binding protein SmpB [Oscillospiraceae bacterium]